MFSFHYKSLHLKLPQVVHYQASMFNHFAYLVLIFCDRKLLSPLPGIYFYTPYLREIHFMDKLNILKHNILSPGIWGKFLLIDLRNADG